MSPPLHRNTLAALLAATVIAVACDQTQPPAELPPPVEVTAEATGHYCGMLLNAHEGPKGQIHLASRAQPIWFTSVRDTVAFTRLPEEPRDIRAIYVSDMARSRSYEQPDAGAWVEAHQAWFVIGSAMRGGMGAPEAVPFSDAGAAASFRDRHGGQVVRLAEISDAYVLGPVDLGTGAVAPPPTAPPQ
jgi:copper chaperone NosL